MQAVTTEEKNTALKGRMVSMTVLVLHTADLQHIDALLQEKAEQAPAFFNGAPLLLDLENLDEEVDLPWLRRLSAIIAERGFVPVGVAGADELLETIAREAGIPVWPSGGTPRNTPQPKDETQKVVSSVIENITPKHEQEPAGGGEEQKKHTPFDPDAVIGGTVNPKSEQAPTMVLKTPVRSGQRVYAKSGDLIVLSSVNTGAEVMADGHIHVYGALRGRALAGVKGNVEARIFCHSLEADLIAIAGYYLTNEDLPADKRGRAVQISLSQEHLIIDAL